MQAGAASHAVKSEVPCHRNSALKPSSYLQDSCKSGRSQNGRDGSADDSGCCSVCVECVLTPTYMC